MNMHQYTTRLFNSAQAICHLVQGVESEQARWKPAPDEWSILETVNHLYDEERRDFRVRIDYTLHKPGEAWPPIDPQKWVVDEAYSKRKLNESLDNFIAERRKSLSWLAKQREADWSTKATAPWGDTMSAGQLLACWAAHDLLHLRQLNELHYLYLQKLAAPQSIGYAGEW